MIKRVKVKKKGLSPVIASVLLILLVIVLASLIFLWARGFVTEQIEKFGQPVEAACSGIEFEANIVDGLATNDALEVVNRGSLDIYRMEVKMIKGGEELFQKFEYKISVGSFAKGDIYLAMGDGSKPDEIIVYPALLGGVKGKDSNKVFTCLDKGKNIKLNLL